MTRSQAERYRDRYKTGRRARTDQRERAALREVLNGIGRIPIALDLPCGTGRLSPVLAEASDRVILADSSPVMLQIAREELPHLAAEHLLTNAENIELADESVYLIFCHRFLPHINDLSLRKRIVGELRRVTRRFVLLSYYPPGFRSRVRWIIRCLLQCTHRRDQLATEHQFVDEISVCGLRLVKRQVLRTFPAAAFFLFEREL
ncbi:MAG: class I SAM-dependent methyltransferase [Planctomycetes bacterium]|nr:class I SAM-dependent methyltransferase [Planctomycetota bacterium]